MRLLLAIPYYAPAYAFGGSVTVAETIVDGFLEAGHEVTVVTTDVLDERARRPSDTPAQPSGARVVAFPNLSHRAAAALNVYLPRGLRAWLRENAGGFDAVLLHDVYSAVSVLAARAAKRAGVPYALQPLGTLSPAPERGRGVAKQGFLKLWGDRTVAEAAALVHSTTDERNDFLAVGADEARLWKLPLPLDLPEPPAVPLAPAPTVVSVGRLHPIKGLDRLIRAVAIARRDLPDLRLDIAGPGDRYGRQLAELARAEGVEHAVRFLGFISAEEKLRMLAGAHAFALLSKSEGLPMAALEAMACGAPALLSEGCHIPEVQGRAGVVVDGTPEATAAALVALLRDEPRRARLAAGAREFAADFRRERVMPQMVAGFEAIAAQRPPTSATTPRQ